VRIGPEVTAVTSGGSKVTGVETSEGSIEAGTVVVEAWGSEPALYWLPTELSCR
jgi:glycine/D-amino acid oxidase-like deaminating enzyme